MQFADAEKLAAKENMKYFEISAKNDINVKKMFYSALAYLSCFDQIEKTKEKIAEELLEENDLNAISGPESGIKLNNSLTNRKNSIIIKDKINEINKEEKQQCKC